MCSSLTNLIGLIFQGDQLCTAKTILISNLPASHPKIQINPLIPKVELMGQILPNLVFLLVALKLEAPRFHVRFSTRGH